MDKQVKIIYISREKMRLMLIKRQQKIVHNMKNREF